MKKRSLIFFAALFILDGLLYGQDLLLTFNGRDISVDSVRIENLNSGEKAIAGGDQVLRLKRVITGVEKSSINAGQDITFSPNPMNESSVMEFSLPVASETFISIIDLAGKEILKLNDYLPVGHHSYRLSGIKEGIHFVMVRSSENTMTGTLVSVSTQGNANAEYINTVSLKQSGESVTKLKNDNPEKKGSYSEVIMQYKAGDSLKFTASAGNYHKVIFDVPDVSKTMTFEFFECLDGDKNEYPSVKIGNFIWMTENLRTTTFNDGTPIKYEKDDIAWAALDDNCIPAYCWYNNDEGYKNAYGGLYNSAVVSGVTGKNVCPAGWHVAVGEWEDLFSYLDSAAAHDGEVSKTAGNLIKESGNMHWKCDNKATNETGFTALPGGLRKPGFEHIGDRACFWEGSIGKFIIYCTSGIVDHLSENNDYGVSVRCVKDKELDILFSASGASATVSDVRVENLTSGALVTLKGNQKLHLGHEAGQAGIVFMQYLPGQNLKFTGMSGKYSTVLVEKPVANRTITFNFIPCTDGDGNNYPVVRIGKQVWMAENLKTTKYRDGSPIPYIDYPLINGLSCGGDPGYSWYNDDSGNKNIYGGLYTLNSLRTKKLCPAGWHAMDHFEMDSLISFLGGGAGYQAGYGGRSDDGGKLKETGTAHWKSPNGDATNETGFTALPGGIREGNGTFRGIGEIETFMAVNVCNGSATDGCMYEFNYANGDIHGDEYPATTSTSVRCIYGGGPQILSTWIDSASVDLTSVTAGGEIDELENVTEKGLCWGNNYSYNSPTINDSHATAGSGAGRFSLKVMGLKPGTLYWLRAYAKNGTGITYADPVSFTTSIQDIDGNIYKTELLDQGLQGIQIWMASNLRTTRLNDKTTIAEVSASAEWRNANFPAFCSYDNQENNQYGFLYNWFTVATGKLCPEGFLIADTIEFRINECLSGCNPRKRTLIPVGMRESTGEFKEKGEAGYFWSRTADENGERAWTWFFKNESSEFSRSALDKKSGLSVRCYKHTLPDKGLDISFSASGESQILSDVRVENLTTGTSLTLKGNQILNLGQDTGQSGKVFMEYLPGQNLKFTGISGKYSTVIVDKPTMDKTITFDFVPCTDGDGNNYPVVKIGADIWMAQNLKATQFNDGTPIQNVTGTQDWISLSNKGTPAYCWYNDDVSNKEVYGGLYNFPVLGPAAADTKNVCPVGWHVAGNHYKDELFGLYASPVKDWFYLLNYLDPDRKFTDSRLLSEIAGAKLKETGTQLWQCQDNVATNKTGFSARPGGQRNENDASFMSLGNGANFWNGYGIIGLDCSGEVWEGEGSPDFGEAIRCVKDPPLIMDVDGNAYETIEIGTQVWMKQNLRTTRLNDETPIQLITDDDQAWWNSVAPAYCYYPGIEPHYGAIYNWQSVNTNKLCPSGWRVPSNSDWSVLTGYLIANGYNFDGTYDGNKIAKALADYGSWQDTDLPGTPGSRDHVSKMDASRFRARAAGHRGSAFSPPSISAVFWSSSPAHYTGYYYVISYNQVNAILSSPDEGDKQSGWSVRCMKDK